MIIVYSNPNPTTLLRLCLEAGLNVDATARAYYAEPGAAEEWKTYDTVLAVGSAAAKALFGRAKAVSKPGPFTNKAGQTVWLCQDPGLLYYQPMLRATLVTTIRSAAASSQRTPISYTETVPAAMGPLVAFDIETDFDYETRTGGDNITMIGVSDGNTNVVSSDYQSVLQRLQNRRLVGFNSWSFDVPELRKHGAVVPWGEDVMPMAYLLDETQPLGLEYLACRYLKVPAWKHLRDDDMRRYNALDAKHTFELYQLMSSRLGDRKAIISTIMFPAFKTLRAVTGRGIFIDKNAIVRAQTAYNKQMEQALPVLQEAGIRNPSSPQQVGKVLTSLGYRLPFTPTGEASTGAVVLAGLRQTPLIQALRAYRKASKAISAFCTPYDAIASTGDSRAHTEYTLWRTVTGRTAAYKPNVQQIGRDPLLRGFFNAEPGNEFVMADYAAIEFRVAGFVANEPRIIQNYAANPAWDPHTWFASVLYNKPEGQVTKLERQIAKSANFGLLYMAQWFTLQAYAKKTANIDLSEAQAEHIREVWHKAYPAFQLWYATTDEELRLGYVESLTGRRRHFGQGEFNRAAALREAVNFKVQSLSADIALLGLANVHRAGLPVNGFFHDAISLELPVGEAYRNLSILKQEMTVNPGKILTEKFGVQLTIPLQIEVKTGEKSWVV